MVTNLGCSHSLVPVCFSGVNGGWGGQLGASGEQTLSLVIEQDTSKESFDALICGYQGPQITLYFQGTRKSAAKSGRAVREGNADLGFEWGAQSWRSPKGTFWLDDSFVLRDGRWKH